MSFRTAAATLAAVSVLAAGSPAFAADNPPATNCLPSIAEKTGGYYDHAAEKGLGFWFFMQSGTGTLPFSQNTMDQFKRADVKVEPICPVGGLKGGKGLWTPVGADGYSNMNLVNGRIWYPGGWKFTSNKTGNSFRTEGFWLHNLPLIDKASGNGYVNGSTKPVETLMATFDTLDTYLQIPTLGFQGIGPKNWKFYLAEAWAKQLNDLLGTHFKKGDHVLTLAINATPIPGVQAALKEGYERDEH
ncbi:hypothetical protein [Streptomyces sp. NPDC050738]|uniref:hypothetical protein n=1 Tax=Streptomyces sp. NPDC050738 TaxID=3154744 RepID=UPI00342308CC